MKKKKGVTLWTLIAIGFTILFAISALMFLLDYQQYEKKYSSDLELMTMYNNHINKFQKDSNKINEMTHDYEKVKANVDESTELLDDFIDYQEVEAKHLDDFEAFINNNEAKLKILAIDITKARENIKAARQSALVNNDRIKAELQKALSTQEFSQEQKNKINNILVRL